MRHTTLKDWHATPVEDEISIPQMIKEINNNYKAAHFGKWHLRPKSLTPEVAGYDVSDGPTGNYEGDWVRNSVKNSTDDLKGLLVYLDELVILWQIKCQTIILSSCRYPTTQYMFQIMD